MLTKKIAIKLFAAAVLVLFAGCHRPERTKIISDSPITKNTTTQIKQKTEDSADHINDIDVSNVLGTWTDGSSENATFEIKKDSIYYVEQFASYKYSLSGDSIRISYPDWTFTGAVSFNKDTMIIASVDGTTKYWRFKD